ncbi:MAG TPA: cytidylate kinase-like family protein [Candidatus Binatus sp.]|uniref:cytidylate kinase-like family protein n=1 Tax=Candidatus Binatus sp. TaxID=2811406 RepID=UPI002F425881
MAVIAISQQIGSRGIELGELAARELGYRFQSGEQLIAETAKRFNVSAEQVKWFDVHSPHFWERKTDTGRFAAYYRAVFLQEAAQDRIVVAGRGSSHFLPEGGCGIRVRTMAPVALRIKQVAKDEKLAPAAADKRVRDFDMELKARIQTLFGQDIEDPAIYDLVINTSRLPLAAHANTLAALATHIDSGRTPERTKCMQDAAIAAQVHAALVAHPKIGDTQMSVNCSAGCVRVSGVGLVPPWDELVIGVAQRIEGVSSVEVGAEEDPVTLTTS